MCEHWISLSFPQFITVGLFNLHLHSSINYCKTNIFLFYGNIRYSQFWVQKILCTGFYLTAVFACLTHAWLMLLSHKGQSRKPSCHRDEQILVIWASIWAPISHGSLWFYERVISTSCSISETWVSLYGFPRWVKCLTVDGSCSY